MDQESSSEDQQFGGAWVEVDKNLRLREFWNSGHTGLETAFRFWDFSGTLQNALLSHNKNTQEYLYVFDELMNWYIHPMEAAQMTLMSDFLEGEIKMLVPQHIENAVWDEAKAYQDLMVYDDRDPEIALIRQREEIVTLQFNDQDYDQYHGRDEYTLVETTDEYPEGKAKRYRGSAQSKPY